MKKLTFAVLAACLLALISMSQHECRAQEILKPDATFMFAERDSAQLFMDVYYPADGSDGTFLGEKKPTILYVFGGGFKGGRRDTGYAKRWFRLLVEQGFTVAAIDYRLGLKDVTKMGLGQASLLYDAIQMAVEDLYAATNYIIDNAVDVDIDPASIVIAGSSAGAITVLQADWEICNSTPLSKVLPEGFRYVGVMSFSGAIYSKMGKVRYRDLEPAPTMMLHGTADNIVPYKQIRLFNQAFQGTGKIAKEFISKDYDYNIYRFDGNSHEIAAAMVTTFPEQIRWLETNIICKEKRTVDTLVNDPEIQPFVIGDVKDIYSGSVNLD